MASGLLKPLYVLIHSPLVGPLTWRRVADELRRRGEEAITPVLTDRPDVAQPFWQQHATAVATSLATSSPARPLVLVAHSGAGPLLPAIRQALPHPVAAYLFVDAGLPRANASRLDLMRLEDPTWAAEFEQYLRQGNRFPTWTAEDLREVIPDDRLRQQMVAELHPRDLTFFSEPIPVFDTWPDAPCAYLYFSPSYAHWAHWAQRAGWPVHKIEAGHFHMLVDPAAVADVLVAVTQRQDR
jgi:hypothetical protein